MSEPKRKSSHKWGVKCRVKACGITKRHRPTARFFRFPKSGTDLFDKWIKACGITEVLHAKALYVCDSHFTNEDKLIRKKKKDALPTLNLTKNSNDAEVLENKKDSKSEIISTTSSINFNKSEKFQREKSISITEDLNNFRHFENEDDLEIINTPNNDEKKVGNSNENESCKIEKSIDENMVKIVLFHNNVPTLNLCIFNENDQNCNTNEGDVEKNDLLDDEINSQNNENTNVEIKTEFKNDKENESYLDNNSGETITNYGEAVKYLKPLEEFTLLNEDLRAVGLINQLEIYFKEKLNIKQEN